MIGDTIFAIASPPGPAPRGILRISGPGAFTAAETLLAAPLHAEEYVEGIHYERLPVEISPSGDAVEVVEVFSYACVHCFNFDPDIHRWQALQSTDVKFSRLPAIFNETWSLFAQAFYAAEVLGVADKVHTPIFEAIHERGILLQGPKQDGGLEQVVSH